MKPGFYWVLYKGEKTIVKVDEDYVEFLGNDSTYTVSEVISSGYIFLSKIEIPE